MVDPAMVRRALELGLITELEADRYLAPPLEPKSWTGEAERLEHVIDACSSGAPAIAGITMTIEETGTGRRIPPPPTGDPS